MAAQSIAETLDGIDVKSGDLAICGAACGGDLLFAEACLDRGVAVELYIPTEESIFLAQSVDFANKDWNSRYFHAKSVATTHFQPGEGVAASNESPHELHNRWMLERALRFGGEKLIFICLWDGEAGDGKGGTADLMREAKSLAREVHWLNTKLL